MNIIQIANEYINNTNLMAHVFAKTKILIII